MVIASATSAVNVRNKEYDLTHFLKLRCLLSVHEDH